MLSRSRLITAPDQIVALQFHQADVAASQTDVQLATTAVDNAADDQQGTTGYVMPFAGQIIAVSAILSAAATTGTLTVGPTVNGTEVTDPTLSITTAATAYDTGTLGGAGLPTFAAGDSIGAEITTGGTWDGTSSDLTVTIWALVDISTLGA